MEDQSSLDSYRSFLKKYCSENAKGIEQDDSLPIRLHSYYLTQAEVEGESLDICLQYLGLSGCPPLLASHIAHFTTRTILDSDLSDYNEPPDDEDSDKSEGRDPQQQSPPPDSSCVEMDAERFAKGVINELHKTCTRWQSDLPQLHFPSQIQVSCHAIKNVRRKMEDKHVNASDLNSLFGLPPSPSQSYYAVFDGHGGVDAAVYAAAHLHANLVHQPSFQNDPCEAFKMAFLDTDRKFGEKAERENLKSGSTAVCTLIRDRTLYVGWLGDSQAMLVRDGSPVTLMSAHKPEREDEKQRIEKLGGCVVWFGAWRVNGSLSVSRALGDFEHKPYISGVPDVATFDLDGTEDYLVLGCDGLWDIVSAEDVPLLVYDYLQEPGASRDTVAQKLVNVARDEGSNDNISVIVVFLRENIGKPSVSAISQACEAMRVSKEGNENTVTEHEEDANLTSVSNANQNDKSSNQEVTENSKGNDATKNDGAIACGEKDT